LFHYTTLATTEDKATRSLFWRAAIRPGVMSSSTTPEVVDAQLESYLLQAPYDIRHKILNYLVPSSIHVFQSHGVLKMSDCVGCPPEHRLDHGKERREGIPPDPETREQRWARRLMSSWDPHWKCEEAMLQTREHCDSSNAGSCCATDALM
jgi:hypothetical protein